MSLVPSAFEFPIIPRGDDEGLFSRDIDGQLVRLDKPTEADYRKNVTLQIDGKTVTVRLATPLKDAQGNDMLDVKGRPTPRYTTIYDAAVAMCDSAGAGAKVPIPILCHQPHLRPVAVCRLCVVQIYGQKHGRRMPERKLLPACQHQVKEGMEVFTMNAPGADGERVRRVVGVLTELLSADQLKPAPPPAPAEELAPFNELQQAADRFAPHGSRFSLPVAKSPRPPQVWAKPPTAVDDSSPVFVVDHGACILCDRCARACADVKENHIIGRTGKGAGAGIGFDLGVPMGKSDCVQCGECMVSCPTSAITFKRDERVESVHDRSHGEVLSVAELTGDPMFAGVPPKFLLWQRRLVLRRQTKKGEALCQQGGTGNTAFLLKSGRIKIEAYAPTNGVTIRGKRGKPVYEREIDAAEAMSRWLTEPDAPPPLVGEMACLSGVARLADIVALEDGEVWEMRRNVLDRVMRSPALRGRIEKMFRERTLDAVLRLSDMLKSVPLDVQAQCVDFLRQKLEFVRASPGQTLFLQGETSDCLYLLRLGHLKLESNRFGGQPAVSWRGPGSVVGEIGLLGITRQDAAQTNQDAFNRLAKTLDCSDEHLALALPEQPHTGTCTALDHVEMARVRRLDFLAMARKFPEVRNRLAEMALDRLRHSDDSARPAIREFIELGLYQAQSLLAVDLDNCTRCDECTRACVDQHGTDSHGTPITRMFRDGMRFGDYLVATSCRSCKEAACMVGCPVDAIHRGKHQQIVIEDHCIGCELCAKNCPYGNISIEEDLNHVTTVRDPEAPGGLRKVAKSKASVCDLCDAKGELDEPLPRCVYACPHDAAHRMTGDDLLKKVMAGR